MNYQEFLTEVRVQIESRMEPGVKLRVQRLPRNNGTSYDGLVILRPGRNVSPTIYLTPYYHRYLEGVCLEDIYADILTTYESHMPEQNFDTSLFTDFDRVRGRLVMRLVNAKRNEIMLADVPHMHFQDLAVVFYCLLHVDEDNQASILVHNEHLELWKIDTGELYRLAMANTPRLLPYELTRMEDILKEQPERGAWADEAVPMYVLSNRYRTNGASAILYEQLLQEIAEKLDSNLIILPSSIHEVILLMVEDDADMEVCSCMVREVNEAQLADEEVLAEHAYYYDRKTRMMTW